MTAPMEVKLNHPVEIDGTMYHRLSVADYSAIVNFRTNSPEQVIRSMSNVFAVPRKTIRHLHPDDAQRAGDLIVSMLDETANSFR